MKNTQDQPSWATSSRIKQKIGISLVLLAITATAGAFLGNVFSGLVFGALLALPLIIGGG